MASTRQLLRHSLQLPLLLQRAVRRAIEHDAPNLSQSCAYSAIVTLFPALIVTAAVIGLLPDTAPIRTQLTELFDHILPPQVSPLLQSYFVAAPRSERSSRVLLGALLVSISGASSVMATLMEGVRRAHGLPHDCWTFWQRRRRAYTLVPLSLLPLALASGLVVFGHRITLWLAGHIAPEAQPSFFAFALVLRWSVALAGSVALIALVYRLGSPLLPPWRRTLPGAAAATVLWFLTTLAFGWYVTRFADYSQVYGSLGAGIALLFWLYLVSFSVLTGAEFNNLFCDRFLSPQPPPPAPASSPAHLRAGD